MFRQKGSQQKLLNLDDPGNPGLLKGNGVCGKWK